jgi:hypothetical protein
MFIGKFWEHTTKNEIYFPNVVEMKTDNENEIKWKWKQLMKNQA